MTQEERDAIRARYEAAQKEMAQHGRDLSAPGVSVSVYSLLPGSMYDSLRKMLSTANRDIPALLDALDEAEKGMTELHDVAVKEVEARSEIAADRDRWKARAEEQENISDQYQHAAEALQVLYDASKARAEALERALRGDCPSCVHNHDYIGNRCPKRSSRIM